MAALAQDPRYRSECPRAGDAACVYRRSFNRIKRGHDVGSHTNRQELASKHAARAFVPVSMRRSGRIVEERWSLQARRRARRGGEVRALEMQDEVRSVVGVKRDLHFRIGAHERNGKPVCLRPVSG